MKTALALILALAGPCAARLHPQTPAAPSAIGQWKVDFLFDGVRKHSLRFDANDAGSGSILLLDVRSSLIEPAQSSEGKWTQSGNLISFSGTVEFPIGNVGRDVGLLVLNGTFETADLISGTAEFFHFLPDSKEPEPKPSRTGTFKATRVTGEAPPRVQLLSPSFGKLRRGGEVDIVWQADSHMPITFQQVFLSLDNGRSFQAISGLLDASAAELMWIVPETLPQVKKARLRIVVVNSIGVIASDTSAQKFKIR